MANRDNFGFMFTFSQFMVPIAESMQQRLECLPAEILSWSIVLLGLGFIITHVFKLIMKNKQPIQLCSLRVPAWVIPSVGCMILVTLLLFL